MNFGAINSDGGERRLNVLFTRARIACEIFASFDPSDIDLSRTAKNREGPRVLRKFLEYAKSGRMEDVPEIGGLPDSPFEMDVAREIKSLGYEVVPQVGVNQFKIDIGVVSKENNSNYILAVECDGASYHSSLSARERDRWRQETLEGFGWRFHRIWSTDWFYSRSEEIKRLKNALEQASNPLPVSTISNSNSSELDHTDEPDELLDSLDGDGADDTGVFQDESVQSTKSLSTKYECLEPLVSDSSLYEPHKMPRDWVINLAVEIVKLEGLIHCDEVVRRYADAFRKSRAGKRIQATVLFAVEMAVRQGLFKRDGDFLGTGEQFVNPPIRDRSDNGSKNPDHIAPQEIRACAKLIEKHSGKVELDELTREIASTLGFGRAGVNIRDRIKSVLAQR